MLVVSTRFSVRSSKPLFVEIRFFKMLLPRRWGDLVTSTMVDALKTCLDLDLFPQCSGDLGKLLEEGFPGFPPFPQPASLFPLVL